MTVINGWKTGNKEKKGLIDMTDPMSFMYYFSMKSLKCKLLENVCDITFNDNTTKKKKKRRIMAEIECENGMTTTIQLAGSVRSSIG